MYTDTNSLKASRDFDLNLAPIIDCLTVLITFMLGSTVFLSVGILDVVVPSSGSPKVVTQPPTHSLEIDLSLDGETTVKVLGQRGLVKKIGSVAGTWNVRALAEEVDALKKKFPAIQSVTLGAHDDVEYVQYIRVMETLRAQLPLVFLGGL